MSIRTEHAQSQDTEAVIGGKIGECNLSMSKIGKYMTVFGLV